jgi:glycosyltransferase involved in cell wall biosynthesis
MKADIVELYGVDRSRIRVIHNGIDLAEFSCTVGGTFRDKYRIDKPYILFVGRISRQKGILHLLEAVRRLKPRAGRRSGERAIQVVLAATSPDTPELLDEVRARIESLKSVPGVEVVWIQEMVPKDELVCLYSGAELFVCPSIYEPFGIINLEAMACSTAVVASAVGGIKEVVVPGETGLLVPLDSLGEAANFEPRDPARFEADLAEAIDVLLASPDLVRTMAAKARRRVEEHFSWRSIAAKTLDFYREVMARHAAGQAKTEHAP